MTQMTDEIRRSIHTMLTARPNPSARQTRRRRIAGGGPRVRNRDGSHFPYHSDALGVGEDQIEEARDEMARNGVSCDFDSEGRAIITGPAHYKKVAKAAGMKDGAHGYVQRNEDDKIVHTGREHSERKAHALREMRKYAAGEDCDPTIARMVERASERM